METEQKRARNEADTSRCWATLIDNFENDPISYEAEAIIVRNFCRQNNLNKAGMILATVMIKVMDELLRRKANKSMQEPESEVENATEADNS